MLGVKRVTPFGRWSSLAEPEGLLMFHLFVSLGAENMGVFALGILPVLHYIRSFLYVRYISRKCTSPSQKTAFSFLQ